MTDPFRIGGTELPDDLKALDSELDAIQYEERPSFGPELRAELAEAWSTMPQRRPSALRRHLAAAILAALLVGGASVPSARASFVRLIESLNSEPVVAPVAEEAPVVAVFEEEEPVEAVEAAIVEPEPIVAPEVSSVEAPAIVEEPVMIAPEMLDRSRLREILQDAYPMRLQRQGVGGTTWLRLWVDQFGVPGEASVRVSSGVSELDQAALIAVPRFRFAPALQNGRRMGTWIEFSVIFEPDPTLIDRVLSPLGDPLGLPPVAPEERWTYEEPLDVSRLPAPDAWVAPVDIRSAAEASLAEALGDPSLVARYGPLSSILKGEAPLGNGPVGGTTPTEWREAVGSALERSMADGVETPVALLALGRIRLRQGLGTEARSLFERGLQTTIQRPDDVDPWVLAELHFERGTLLRESWLASYGVGRVHAEAFYGTQCTQARSSGGADSGFASVQRLVAWNYLCPRQLAEVFGNGFELTKHGVGGDLTVMMASMRAAAEAYPAHVGANTDLLVTLASEGRWDDVLAGARRFTRVSGGHPNGLLLAGVALHRLGRSGEAAERFEAALERLPQVEAEELSDVTFLLDESDVRRYQRASSVERREIEERMWRSKDRSPSTEVNERRVEHLARATMARLRFGSVFGDAGEVWVRFGGPKTIHIVDEGSGRLTEFWDYGSGPDITFVRWVSSKRTDLTPEGRAYVDDLGKIFPPQ